MKRAKVVDIPLLPGAVTDDTDLAAKLHVISMDKMRVRGKRWQTIGGFSEFDSEDVTAGIARGGHVWANLAGTRILAAASQSAVNVWVDGVRATITPKWADVFLATDSLAFASGADPTCTVTWNVYDPATDTSSEAPHFLAVGDSITITGFACDDAGVDTINGTWTIATVPTATTFTFTATGSSSSGSGTGGEFPYVVTVAFKSGLSSGTGDTPATRTRVYSMDNYGENLVFCGSDGTPIWSWEPATSYPELLTNGTFTGGLSGWTTGGAGWAGSSNKAAHTGATPGTLSQDISDSVTGGKTYELSFVITDASASSSDVLNVKIDSIIIYPEIDMAATNSDANLTYTCRFVMPANPTLLTFTANNSITVDTVSLKHFSLARPINEAPTKNYALFVDGNRILNAVGSVEADGDFNPILLRWCDQDNYREWVPDTDNVAGELSLGRGSYGMGGRPVGEVNLVWTDDSVHRAVFTPTGYSVQLIGQGCGAIGQRAFTAHNNRAFWASKGGFYAYDGAQVLAVECPIKDQYVGQLKQYQDNKTFAWNNHEFGEFWVHYPHTSDGSEVSRYVAFNYLEPEHPWMFGTFDRVVWLRAGVYPYPIAIDSSGNLWNHEISNVMASGTLPYLETGYATSGDGDRWLGCRRYYPDVENQTGNMLFTITGKTAPQGQNNTQTVGPMTMTVGQRALDFFISARQLKCKWASVASPTSWRLGVVGMEVIAERERR